GAPGRWCAGHPLALRRHQSPLRLELALPLEQLRHRHWSDAPHLRLADLVPCGQCCTSRRLGPRALSPPAWGSRGSRTGHDDVSGRTSRTQQSRKGECDAMTTKKQRTPDDEQYRREGNPGGGGPEGADSRAELLEPQPDVLLYLEVPDELLKYYLSLSRASGMVYALAVKQLINRLYRDHDYVRRRKLEGRRTAYDTAVERDS